MISENVIAKGNYRHSQIGRFVSVKNYIFLRERDQKYLLLRFSNELDYTVSSMVYTVFQYDADGKTIARTRVSHRGLCLCRGETYAPQKALRVDERCVDFKVVFSEVCSGNYRYRTDGSRVSVSYTGGEEFFDPETPQESDAPISGYSVRKKSFGRTRRAVLAVLTAVLLLIGLNVLRMFFSYELRQREANAAIAYSEIDNGGIPFVQFPYGLNELGHPR